MRFIILFLQVAIVLNQEFKLFVPGDNIICLESVREFDLFYPSGSNQSYRACPVSGAPAIGRCKTMSCKPGFVCDASLDGCCPNVDDRWIKHPMLLNDTECIPECTIPKEIALGYCDPKLKKLILFGKTARGGSMPAFDKHKTYKPCKTFSDCKNSTVCVNLPIEDARLCLDDPMNGISEQFAGNSHDVVKKIITPEDGVLRSAFILIFTIFFCILVRLTTITS